VLRIQVLIKLNKRQKKYLWNYKLGIIKCWLECINLWTMNYDFLIKMLRCKWLISGYGSLVDTFVYHVEDKKKSLNKN